MLSHHSLIRVLFFVILVNTTLFHPSVAQRGKPTIIFILADDRSPEANFQEFALVGHHLCYIYQGHKADICEEDLLKKEDLHK